MSWQEPSTDFGCDPVRKWPQRYHELLNERHYRDCIVVRMAALRGVAGAAAKRVEALADAVGLRALSLSARAQAVWRSHSSAVNYTR
jgi:hypothetical protein